MDRITKIITIDGPAGSGKTSAARFLAGCLDGFLYLDTGAVYRAIAYALTGAGFTSENFSEHKDECAAITEQLPLGIRYAGTPVQQIMTLHGNAIPDPELRTQAISELSSVCSEDPRIRDIANRIIREATEGRSLVAEGRDTGSKLFPDAGLKFYLWAEREARARRRMLQGVLDGHGSALEAISMQLAVRDRRDAGRSHAPLTVPDGAFWIDTTHMDEAQVHVILRDAAMARYVSARVI